MFQTISILTNIFHFLVYSLSAHRYVRYGNRILMVKNRNSNERGRITTSNSINTHTHTRSFDEPPTDNRNTLTVSKTLHQVFAYHWK